MKYPLPKDTTKVLEKQVKQCRNLGLWRDRFLQVDDDWSIPIEVKKQDKGRPRFRGEADEFRKACLERQQQLLATWRAKGYHPEKFAAVTDYRLIVGFGAEHVLESSLCLHRIFGFPIIPGSSIKGVTRSWAFWQIAEQLRVPLATLEELEERKKNKQKTPLQKLDQLLSEGVTKKQQEKLKQMQKDELCSSAAPLLALDHSGWAVLTESFYRIFGTTEKQGEVLFFDAYPKATPELETDILNPHYGPWYSNEGRKPPADYHNPIPNYFLTVAAGTPFSFALASKDNEMSRQARTWLTAALSELGIGGKTSSGYGFMRCE